MTEVYEILYARESGDKIVEALVETGYMVFAAIVAAVLLGLPLTLSS